MRELKLQMQISQIRMLGRSDEKAPAPLPLFIEVIRPAPLGVLPVNGAAWVTETEGD